MSLLRSHPTLAKTFLQFFIAAFLLAFANAQFLTHEQILVVFNEADSESAKLAEAYRAARNIPENQVLGLNLPLKADISRDEYQSTLLKPLREYFDSQNFWKRGKDAQGILLPIENRIRCIVLMRGVPLRITAIPSSSPADGEAPPKDPISPRDEASVDSELALFGVETLPEKGILQNAFYDSKVPLSKVNAPYLVLTARIDSSSYAICKRMINDSVATEKTGLWGRAYVDIANKIPEGDQWLNSIISRNQQYGIPTVTDRFNDTLPKNYPMTEPSLYYGWYDWNVSGPFLNTGFKFRRGAIAVHLHSFSGQQLTDPHQNWCAPLLARGAAATVGNVYEPYLHLTHHFDILHDRLLKGWSFGEAAWAAMPVASWQGITLGDPLYRPFLHIDGTGENRGEDRDFRALRAASRQWSDATDERRAKLAAAAQKLSSGNIAEGLALDYQESKDSENAAVWFNNAKTFYSRKEDQLRQDMQLIAIDRAANNTQAAISALRAALKNYGTISETAALSGWLDILDPPPPPVADPSKIPGN
ncbi:TIGR03790 family protein [Luteolibacter algae]|uniref:TIGR03790 family protein n=1 Tax=Luteolibacter algae TaxID=454151 RepID=A0ABW5D7M9_9BACT